MLHRDLPTAGAEVSPSGCKVGVRYPEDSRGASGHRDDAA